jgi:dTDP-4-dehydrorhamnose reductase
MRILITGGSGQVGRALKAARLPRGVTLSAPPRAELDLADPGTLASAIASGPWAAVINAGAYTAVDRAESEPEAAWAANALGPALLAEATYAAGIPLVHLSTDYVFAGDKQGAYVEEDPIGPLGVYGASKAAGEIGVRAGNPRHLIARTAWVVSPDGSNFLKTMLRLGAERPNLRVVDDQHGAPTSAKDIAEALIEMATRLATDPDSPTGTYHLVNAGETTWCGFAREIFREAATQGGPCPDVEAITTADYPTPARRPANSRLCADKLARDFGVRLRPWPEATAEIVAKLLQSR